MNSLISRTKVVALSLLAAAGVTLAPQALAQQYYNPGGAIVGGLIGGAIGSQVHGRHDRAVATATLATIGAVIGSQAGNSYQPSYYSQPVYDAPVVYSQPRVYYDEPVVYARPRVYYSEPVVVYRYRDSRWGDRGHRRHHRHWEDR